MSDDDVADLVRHLRGLQARVERSWIRREINQDNPDFIEPPEAHKLADEALLTYIGDNDVSAAFWDIDKWYS